MKLADFDYNLPAKLIAQEPLAHRTDARLLVLNRLTGEIKHRQFTDIAECFGEEDCLVLNDTRVLKARLFGKKETGGKVEVLLHKELDGDRNEWEVLLNPSGRIRMGSVLSFQKNGQCLKGAIIDGPSKDSGMRRIRFHGERNVPMLLDDLGHVPLPPYIDRPDTDIDQELYQTVFAKFPGAVASPTAGLHFNSTLLEKIKEKGTEVIFVTLHVGYGTFQPVAVENIEDHNMVSERYEVSSDSAQRLNKALSEGRKIIACGTTSLRVLETVVQNAGDGAIRISEGAGDTALFIYPSYPFKVASGLITNFHLPKTTLVMLTAAFAGQEKLFNAYEEAIRERYRFYSYGDAMLIL
uniref:S-adenosylmethionine:tRNA ribosyltransferase-isomerase n=1 Tax=uncultured bacterium W4-21b TaxID=1130993 RepID=H9BWN7_9BACT|nr:S-adenosylmethionine:tRNA ribosyltransferase-isomerase [uncultured bacterium W4-21b]